MEVCTDAAKKMSRVHGTIYRTTRMLVFDLRQVLLLPAPESQNGLSLARNSAFGNHFEVIIPALLLRFHERNFGAAFRLHPRPSRPDSSCDPHSPLGFLRPSGSKRSTAFSARSTPDLICISPGESFREPWN